MQKIIIYTDGASKGNPGKGGWGAIVASETEVKELGGAEANTTNNRMELLAAYEALKAVSPDTTSEIIFRADSAYVIKGATMWQWGWRKNGWKTKEGNEVANLELWQPFVVLVNTFGKKIKWENVGGHVEIPGNERVDEIASSFALGTPPQLYTGPRSAYPIDLETIVANTELQTKKSQTRARAKQAAYSYVSEVNGEIQTHKTWGECKARVEGKKARYKKAVSTEEEKEIIKLFSSKKAV
jgi:ribonuclease HI